MTENMDWLTDGCDGDLELTEVDIVRNILEECVNQKWDADLADTAERKLMALGYSLALARDVLGTAWYHGVEAGLRMIDSDIDIPLGWESIDTSTD